MPSHPLAPAAACSRDHLPSLLSPAQEPRAGRGLPISPRKQKVQEGVLGAAASSRGQRGCSAEPTRAHQAQPQHGTTLPLFTGHGSRPGIPGPVSTARLAACTKSWAESGALYTGLLQSGSARSEGGSDGQRGPGAARRTGKGLNTIPSPHPSSLPAGRTSCSSLTWSLVHPRMSARRLCLSFPVWDTETDSTLQGLGDGPHGPPGTAWPKDTFSVRESGCMGLAVTNAGPC